MNRILLMCFFLKAIIGFAQYKADDIIGYYYMLDPFTKEKTQSYIYKTENNTYEAIVCWVDNIKEKHALNYVFLRDLRFDSKNNEWVDGRISHPKISGIYRTYMKFVKNNELKVRAYLGLSLFGKTIYWQKEEKQRIQK